MKKLSIISVISLLSLPLPGFADSFDVSIHDSAARFEYAKEHMPGFQGLGFDAGFFYEDRANKAVHLGFNVRGDNWSQAGAIKLSMEGRLYAADTRFRNKNLGNPIETDIVSALALGGQIHFSPVKRVYTNLELFYAPGILSFSGAENVIDTALKVGYQVIPQASVYVGYRLLRFDVTNRIDNKMDSDAHIGFQFLF